MFLLATKEQLIENKTFRSLFAFPALDMAFMALPFFLRLLPAIHLLTRVKIKLLCY